MSQINTILDQSSISAEMNADQRADLLNQVGSALAEDKDLTRGEKRQIRDMLNETKAYARNTEVSEDTKEAIINPQTYGPRSSERIGSQVDKSKLPGATPGPYTDEQLDYWAGVGPYAPWMEALRQPSQIFTTAMDFLMDAPKAVPRLPLNVVNMVSTLGSLATANRGDGMIAKPGWGGVSWEKADPLAPPTMGNVAARKTQEWSGDILKQLSKDDPKMAEFTDQILMDGVFSMLLGGTVMSQGVKTAVKSGATSFAAGAAGGQVAAAALEEPIKQAVQNPSDVNAITLGATVLAAIGSGVGVEVALNKVARNPALMRVAKEVGTVTPDLVQEDTTIEQLRTMLQSDAISPETRASFESALKQLEMPDTPTAEVTAGRAPQTVEESAGMVATSDPTAEAMPPMEVIQARIAEREAQQKVSEGLALKHMAAVAEREALEQGTPKEAVDALKEISSEDALGLAKIEHEMILANKEDATLRFQKMLAENGDIDLAGARQRLAVEGPDAVTDIEKRAMELDDELTTIDLRQKKLEADIAEGTRKATDVPTPTDQAIPQAPIRRLSKNTEKLLADKEFQDGLRLAVMNKEAILQRPVTPNERIDLIENIAQKRGQWYKLPEQRAQAPRLGELPKDSVKRAAIIRADSPVFPSKDIAARYPQAARALTIMNNKAVTNDSWFSLNDVARATVAWFRATGPRMNDEVFKRVAPYGQEINQLWDEIRTLVQPEAPTTLLDALNDLTPKGLRGGSTKLVKALEDQFGAAISDISLTQLGDVGMNGYYQLTKRRIGLRETTLDNFTHELGHHVFYHGLDADARMGFLMDLRKQMQTPDGWQKAFPRYADAVATMKNAPEELQARMGMWISSPEEAFAQQAIATLGTNFIPNARTAATLQKAIDKFTRIFGISFDDWKAVPGEFRQRFVKSAVMPKLERLAAEQTTTFDDVVRDLPMVPRDRVEGLKYADELEQMLTEKAGIRLPESVLEDMHIGQLMDDVFEGIEQTPPELIPLVQKVQSYKLEDLNSALTVQVLRGMAESPKFDMAELKLLYARMDHLLNQSTDSEVMARMLSQGTVEVRQQASALDAYTGLPAESFAQRRAGIRESIQKEAERLGDPEAFEMSARYKMVQQEYGRRKREMMMRKKRNLTDEERAQLYRSVDLQFNEPAAEPAKLALENSVARQKYEAFRMEAEPLMDAVRKLLVHSGEAENIPTSFLMDMKAADNFSTIASGRAIGSLAYSTMWRSALLGAAAVESDEENGIATPFGKISFSMDAVMSKGAAGMLALGLVGGKPSVWIGKKLATQADGIINKLSPVARGKLDKFVRGLQTQLGPRGGLTETQNNLVQAFRRDRQATKVEHLELAQILNDALTPKERSVLSMIVTNDIYPGWEGAVKGANMKVRALAETVKDIYARTTNELIEIGISPKKMNEVQDYMNRVYLNREPLPKGKFVPSSLFERTPLGMKLDFLQKRGTVHKVENPKASAAFSDMMYPDAPGSSKQLAQQLKQLNAPEDAVIHSYRVAAPGNPEGTSRVYAIKGTEMDRKLSMSDHAQLDEQTWSVDKLGKNRVSLRRDYTHMERQLMGETMDAALKVGQFGEQVSQDVAKLKMYQRIAENAEHVDSGLMKTSFGDVPNEARINELVSTGWWKVPNDEIGTTGVKKFGALAGKFVSPEMKDVLRAVDYKGGLAQALREQIPTLYKAHKFALGAWKMSKTVAQPATHVTNIVGNVIQNWLAGENVVSTIKHGAEMLAARNFDIRYNQALRSGNGDAMKGLIQKLQDSPILHENWNLYKETRHMQLGESSILSSDMSVQTLLQETLKVEDALKVGESASDVAAASTMMENFINRRWVENTVKGAKAVTRKAAEVYEMGDLFFKLGVYKTARMEGGTADNALSRAYKAHFDYGALPRLPQMMKDSGIMPFASYAYKAAELMADTAVKRPGRLAMAALLFEAIHYRSMAGQYGLENMIAGAEYEQAAITRDGISARRLGLFRTQVATGQREETDAWDEARDVTRYANVGYYIPGGDMFETSAQIVPKEGTGTMLGILSSGINAIGGTAMGSPLLTVLTAAATGQDPFLKRALGSLDSSYVPGSNDEAEKLSDFGKFLYRTAVPNIPILPGTYSNKRLMQGLAHQGLLGEGTANFFGVTGFNSLGMPMDLMTQNQNFFGLRMSSVDAEDSLRRRITRINMAQKESAKAVKGMQKNPAITEQAKEAAIDTYEELYDKKQVEISRLEDLYSSGLSAKEKLQRAITKREAAASGRPALGF